MNKINNNKTASSTSVAVMLRGSFLATQFFFNETSVIFGICQAYAPGKYI